MKIRLIQYVICIAIATPFGTWILSQIVTDIMPLSKRFAMSLTASLLTCGLMLLGDWATLKK